MQVNGELTKVILKPCDDEADYDNGNEDDNDNDDDDDEEEQEGGRGG